MTNEDLRHQFHNEQGINWENSQGEPDIDYVAWLENKVLRSLKSQLSEAGEEKKECSSCQWVKIGYGHCEWCLRNTSYNNELSLKTSGYADNWQPR